MEKKKSESKVLIITVNDKAVDISLNLDAQELRTAFVGLSALFFKAAAEDNSTSSIKERFDDMEEFLQAHIESAREEMLSLYDKQGQAQQR